MAAKEKLTLYFPPELLEEAKREAQRQERSISWIMQTAWMVARDHLKAMPGIAECTAEAIEEVEEASAAS